jgi:hypothetical protein
VVLSPIGYGQKIRGYAEELTELKSNL